MKKQSNSTDRETLALKTWISFTRAGTLFGGRMKESIRRMGLTVSQFGVMEALYHGGPMNLSELASKLQCTPGNLTTVVDNLDKNGRAQRIANSTDRRIYDIHLTEAGTALIKKGFPGHAWDIVEMMGILSSEEQSQLKHLTKKLGKGLAAQITNQKEV